MVYLDIILSTLLILASGALMFSWFFDRWVFDVIAVRSRKSARACIVSIGVTALFIGAIELKQTISQDLVDRKENLTDYCHPYRPERIIIQKSRNSVTMPYKVKVTVLPDAACSKGKRKSKIRSKNLVKV